MCAKSPELPRGYGGRLAVRGKNWLFLLFFAKQRAFVSLQKDFEKNG